MGSGGSFTKATTARAPAIGSSTTCTPWSLRCPRSCFCWVGAGIAGYGAIYFGFHDVIVHKRLNHRYLPKSDYMKRIIQAHRLHHVVETKEGTVSFGFLWAPKPEDLKAELKRRGHAGVRAPARSG